MITAINTSIGTKVRLRRDSRYWGQSNNGIGTIKGLLNPATQLGYQVSVLWELNPGRGEFGYFYSDLDLVVNDWDT